MRLVCSSMAHNSDQKELARVELEHAACEGHVEDVSHLSAHFSNNIETLSWAFYRACEEGQLDVVTWMMEHTVLRETLTVLSWAARVASRRGQLDVVTRLVQHATQLGYSVAELGAVLLMASKSTQWHVVRWLVSNTPADVNCIDNESSSTAMHNVIWRNKSGDSQLLNYLNSSYWPFVEEVCRLVFTYCENVNKQDNNGDSPLHWACQLGKPDIISALLLAGADETATNDNGETPVYKALEQRNAKVLKLMDVSNKWKMLVRSHRLRRRTAARIMMTLLKVNTRTLMIQNLSPK
jgi:ankyrin repeat protein